MAVLALFAFCVLLAKADVVSMDVEEEEDEWSSFMVEDIFRTLFVDFPQEPALSE